MFRQSPERWAFQLGPSGPRTRPGGEASGRATDNPRTDGRSVPLRRPQAPCHSRRARSGKRLDRDAGRGRGGRARRARRLHRLRGRRGTAVERLRALGVADEAIADRLHYIRPNESLEDVGRAELEHLLTCRPALVVIDGVTEALALEGLNLNDNSEVAEWLEGLPRGIRDRTGAAVVVIDHVTKDRESQVRAWRSAQVGRRGCRLFGAGDRDLRSRCQWPRRDSRCQGSSRLRAPGRT